MLGDKFPVVMGKEKAVPSGVATLDENGILAAVQRPSAAGILTENGASVEEALKSGGVPPGGLEGQMLVKAGTDSETPTKWGPWPSNQNLLLNGDFRKPVNRNGKSKYTGTGYTIDRWQQAATNRPEFTAEVLDGTGIKFTLGNARCVWKQQLQNVPSSSTQKYTASLFYSDNKLLTFTSTLTDIVSSEVDGLQIQFESNAVGFIINAAANNVVFIAAKLEPGDQQTLVHKDADGNWVRNDPPNYDLQYLLCSQYSPSTGEFVGSQHSNPNLLDNAYWANKDSIVNQRNQEQYTAVGYTIDRWRIHSGAKSVVLQDNCLELTALPNAIFYYKQILDADVSAYLLGKAVTLSLLLQDNELVTITGVIPSNATSFLHKAYSKGNIFMQKDNTTNLLSVLYSVNAANTANLVAAKLELGSVQTLAQQDADGNWVLNDPAPNKALELAKCQRYQFVVGGGNNKMIGRFDVGTSSNKIFTRISIPLPATMRVATPAIKILGSGGLRLVKIASQIKAVGSIPSTAVPESVFLSENYCYITYETPELTPGLSGIVDTSNVSTFLCIDNNL